MTTNNEELLQKLVRTGMIMRHIDGEGPCPHKHGHGQGHHGESASGHGEGHRGHEGGHGRPEAARFEMGEGVQHPHGPHGHGPEGRPFDGPDCHGKGHGMGHGKGHGKRHGQARALTMISMHEGLNQKDLAFLLGIRPQTMGEMLQRMEERGLVQRKKSETDGRVIEVSLTDEGRDRAAEIAERRALAAADMFAVLTDEEKEQLASILDKLGTELDSHRPKRHCKHAEGDEGEPETVQA